MNRELIFLVSTPPLDPGVETGVPCRIKASNSSESDPLVAFASKDLGRQLISGRNLERDCSLVSFSALAPDHAKKSKKARILFFDRSDLISRYLEDGEHFDFAKHIVTFKDAERRVGSAS